MSGPSGVNNPAPSQSQMTVAQATKIIGNNIVSNQQINKITENLHKLAQPKKME
jgi:hypothetical protein